MALSGQTAVVTGAAMGIGKAITEILLQNGARVMFKCVSTWAAEFKVNSRVFFICSQAAFQKTVDTFGSIDILCNNAGILNEAEWEKCVDINLVAVIRLTYMALEHMNKLTGGRGGVIVSSAGLGPLPSCPVYTATKHAVVGFTRAMAAASTALGYGIRFNAVCPIYVQTDLFANIYDRMGQFSQLAAQTRKSVDKGVLNVSEVAEGLLELVTDETKSGEALILKGDGKTYMTFPTFS
uniref:Zgc:56585 n=1 Tax=Cyclopterus lumpus TaxID=8103 RepID=A0A8C3ACK1_CYCLU